MNLPRSRHRAPPRGSLPGLLSLILALSMSAACAVEQNDTGQTLCYDVAGAVLPCTTGQDGRFGRDVAAAQGALLKTGAGRAGFDFTKIGNNGNALAAGATLGANPADWACTRDNVTGLTWEMKTAGASDLRYGGHTYTWYSTAANNGGNPGSLGTNTCGGTLGGIYLDQCNTANYVAAINAATLCGSGNWRLPTVSEFLSLADYGTQLLSLDADYFPNSFARNWSSQTWVSNSAYAWFMNYNYGEVTVDAKTDNIIYVRLVRDAQ